MALKVTCRSQSYSQPYNQIVEWRQSLPHDLLRWRVFVVRSSKHHTTQHPSAPVPNTSNAGFEGPR